MYHHSGGEKFCKPIAFKDLKKALKILRNYQEDLGKRLKVNKTLKGCAKFSRNLRALKCFTKLRKRFKIRRKVSVSFRKTS